MTSTANAAFGAQMAAQTRELSRLSKTHDRLEKTLHNLEHHVERGAAKGTADGMRHRDQVTSSRVRGR